MGMAQMPLLAALTDKMRWHQARQTLLAENIANADTPGYSARDLAAYSFDAHLRSAGLAEVTTSVTEPGHLAVSSNDPGGFDTAHADGFGIAARGTPVTLEDEMMKLTSNQMDYQAITALYSRSLRLIRTALGRQA